ncbi:MAG: pilus assembly protein CpaB [Candidatus Poriferisodalaceae bacterium]|jgi:pilus assembly protein CpaB
MNKRVAGFALALLLTIVGTFLLVAYVRGAEQRAAAGQELVDVAVFTNDVAAGTSAVELSDVIEVIQVPAKLLPEGALSSKEQLDTFDGYITSTELLKGEEVVASRFRLPDVNGRGLVPVPDGLLEVSVSLDSQRTVGATLRPGDYVAVIASFEWEDYQPGDFAPFEDLLTDEEKRGFLILDADGNIVGAPGSATASTTEIFLQKVLVVNVQREETRTQVVGNVATTEPDPTASPVAPTGAIVVTLALLPDEVEALVHSQLFDNVWLARQELSDAEDETIVRTPRPVEIWQVLR